MNGRPLAGGILTVYQGGTTTLASVFQDIGLILPGSNPMTADDSGRLPLFFVDDGTYRVRLTDASGVTTNGGFDYAQVPSIGPSTGGGGGTPIDPTTVASTGDVKFRPTAETLAGWVRLNGLTIGSATSGATERANADTQALYIYLYNIFPNSKCPVVGGRGANALADFNANKQLTLLDGRDKGLFGLDDMGNAAAGGLTGAVFSGTDTATTAAGYGGEAAHALVAAENAAHTHIAAAVVTDPGHSHNLGTNHTGGAFTTGTFSLDTGGVQPIGATDDAQTGISVAVTNANSGNGTAHNTMPPFLLGTWYMKL